jgi:hypothetical protein
MVRSAKVVGYIDQDVPFGFTEKAVPESVMDIPRSLIVVELVEWLEGPEVCSEVVASYDDPRCGLTLFLAQVELI